MLTGISSVNLCKNMRQIGLFKAGAWFGFLIIFSLKVFGVERVKEVRVDGLRSLDKESVLSWIKLKPGDEFSLDVVSEDIKRIYATGLIDDIKVDKSPAPGEPGWVMVTYIISEKWTVRSVKFEGNKKLNDDDLKAVVTIREHSVFDPDKLIESKEKILSEYEKRGMFLTRVQPKVEEIKKGVVDVVFEIDEYPKPTVRRVDFYGNEKISDRALRRVMLTKQEWYLFFPRKFQEELLEEDLYRLYSYYLDNGFLQAKINPPLAYLDPELDRVYISVFLKEGEQYRVAQVRITGDLVAPEEELKKHLSLKEGEIYRESKLRRDMQYLADFYSNLGYHLADIERELRLDDTLKLVYITYTIHKGPKIYLERIEIKGNQRTLDTVIRRELAVREGYLYSDAQVRRSRNRLLRTGYFEDVQVFDKPGSAPDRMNLEVAVKEAKSGALLAGAGYSSLEKMFFNLQYQQKNFLGRGYDFNVSLQVSSYTQNYYFNFEDPYFLNTPWHLGFNAYSYEQMYYYFNQERKGARITLGRKIPHSEYSRIYLSYSWDLSNLSSFAESSQIYRRQPTDAPTASVILTYRRNALNNFFDPTKGSYIWTSVERADKFLGGENVFTKAMAEVKYFQPIPPSKIGHYLAFRARAGYLWHPDSEKLLITERFFLGGSQSLRGYEPGTISPVFIEDDGTETRIGGNKMVLFSAEYIIPLGQSGFKLAIFYDAGNTFNDNEEIDLGRLRKDWGVGLRWLSPMGPLRFEFGFPIDRREGEEAQVFNFGIGTSF